MTMTVEVLEDGTLSYKGDHLLLTGAIQGNVQTADGTLYNVSPAVIEVQDGHQVEVAHLIGTHYVLNGHPTDDTYIYTPPSLTTPGDVVMALASGPAEAAALNGLDGTQGTTNLIGFVSLHSASPGTTGANENAATGGYARLACTWNAANTGTGIKTNSTALSFSTSGSVPVTHIGTWTLVSAGAYTIGAPLGSTITAATITCASAAISLSAA